MLVEGEAAEVGPVNRGDPNYTVRDLLAEKQEGFNAIELMMDLLKMNLRMSMSSNKDPGQTYNGMTSNPGQSYDGMSSNAWQTYNGTAANLAG